MTRNPLGDNEPLPAPYLTSIYNAHNQEGIVNGCTPSKGTGDFDVDVAAGTALVQGAATAVSAQTVTLNSSDADDRVDLVHVDSAGTVSATTGTAASDPAAPNLPSGEVLIATVLVEGGASDLTSAGSQIYDFRTIVDIDPSLVRGDESDGSITYSSNQSISGVKQATDVTVQSGVTVTVSDWAVIYATGTVTVEGTISADGAGGAGGSGGAAGGSGSPGGNGGAGGSGSVYPTQAGGAGGDAGHEGGNGGDGGDGDTGSPKYDTLVTPNPLDFIASELRGNTAIGAGGGGGGGTGNDGGSTGEDGGSGAAPGGGGEGGNWEDANNDGAAGGDGGDGGGLIAIVASELDGAGTISADATDGQDGVLDTGDDISSGAGGGGSGGMAVAVVGTDAFTGTITAAKGAGGTAPTGSTATGGDGADGVAGLANVYEV